MLATSADKLPEDQRFADTMMPAWPTNGSSVSPKSQRVVDRVKGIVNKNSASSDRSDETSSAVIDRLTGKVNSLSEKYPFVDEPQEDFGGVSIDAQNTEFESTRDRGRMIFVFKSQYAELERKAVLYDALKMENAAARFRAAVEQSSSAKSTVKIEIQAVSRQDTHTSDPKVKAVVEKLLQYKGTIEYQTAKGRAAKPVDEWIQATFIDSKIMTVEELKLVPLWAYRQFNPRLYNAIFNKKRAKPR